MRALIIGPDEQAAIAKVVAFATEPQHWYAPGPTAPIPGENPEYVAHAPDGFRCVFTFTKHESGLFRHLTVSVQAQKGTLPSPEACVALAKEFGFTASTDDLNLIARMEKDGWMTSTGHEGENCIVVVQPLPREGANAD
jgi:hypothetical protein